MSYIYLFSFTSIAFGTSTDSIALYPEKHPFAEAFDACIENFAFRHIIPMPVWKLWRALPIEVGNEGQIKRDMRIINAFADSVMASRQSARSRISDEAGDTHNDIISLFSKHDPSLSQQQLKYIAMNMIIAGRDTTRLLLSWCLFELCKRPEIKRKVYREIDGFAEEHGEEMEYEQIGKALVFTECTLLESLRLNPVVPFLLRNAMEDVQLPNGDVIREGSQVTIPTFVFARNPRTYSDPLRFEPNRYYKKGKDPVNVFSVYEYPFFNINPRLCLGRKLALMESKVFLFYFCRQYHFEMADPNQDIRIKTGIVLNMVEGLRLKLTKR